MTKYKITKYGYRDQETNMLIPYCPGNRHYEIVQKWISEGNIPDPEFTDEEIIQNTRRENIELLETEYKESLDLPAKCVVNGTTYYMDAKYDSAMRFKAAIDMAELINETTIQMVDYYNRVHTVSVEDALNIVIQQAIAFRTIYMKRAIARDVILSE